MSVSAKKLQRIILRLGLLVALLVPAASRAQAPKRDFIVYGGDVVTLDKASRVAEAVWVHDGKIEAVGPREEVMRHKTETTELIDLHGGALLPGFVEPHLHLDFLAMVSFFTDLSPCLPVRYETRKDCPLTIFKALGDLKRDPKPVGSPWMVGFGIDPSRMSLDGTRSASVFREHPAPYLEHQVSATRPVLILDESGHLAYTNRQAFVAAKICANAETCGPKTAKSQPMPPGKWDVGKDGLFTGLLEEVEAYAPFAAVIKPAPTGQEMIDSAEAGARDFARAGVTTMVNCGTDLIPNLFQNLVSRSRTRNDSPILLLHFTIGGNPPQTAAQRDPSHPGPVDLRRWLSERLVEALTDSRSEGSKS